jgi:glycosyltransferase involved in cell wall biosynthesis
MVPVYMNAVDVMTLTSLNEGSPQVIKEAAFCGTPIVSVDVVDVGYLLEGSSNSHIVDRDENVFAEKILEAFNRGENTGFKNLSEFDDRVVSSKIYDLYKYLTGTNK